MQTQFHVIYETGRTEFTSEVISKRELSGPIFCNVLRILFPFRLRQRASIRSLPADQIYRSPRPLRAVTFTVFWKRKGRGGFYLRPILRPFARPSFHANPCSPSEYFIKRRGFGKAFCSYDCQDDPCEREYLEVVLKYAVTSFAVTTTPR